MSEANRRNETCPRRMVKKELLASLGVTLLRGRLPISKLFPPQEGEGRTRIKTLISTRKRDAKDQAEIDKKKYTSSSREGGQSLLKTRGHTSMEIKKSPLYAHGKNF